MSYKDDPALHPAEGADQLPVDPAPEETAEAAAPAVAEPQPALPGDGAETEAAPAEDAADEAAAESGEQAEAEAAGEPEDEAAEVEAAEEEAAEEEAAEEEAAEVEAAEEEAAEEEETEADEEEEPPRLCRRCLEQPMAAGSCYCQDCLAEMKKIRPQLLGWFGAFFTLFVGLIATAIVFLNCAPALQLGRSDAIARRGEWALANKNYQTADEYLAQIHENLGSETGSSPFLMIGSAARVRAADALRRAENPLDAYRYLTAYLSEDAAKKTAVGRALFEENERYQAAFGLCRGPVNQLVNGKSEPGPALAQLEALRENEEVDPVYLDYFLAVLTKYYDCTLEEKLEKYAALDATASASGRDYRWLYYESYIRLLESAGESGSAEALVKDALDADPSNLPMLLKSLKNAVRQKDEAAAQGIYETMKSMYGKDDASVEAAELLLMRYRRDYDGVLERLQGEMEEADDLTRIELLRQQALFLLLEEDYGAAFDAVYNANYTAAYLYQYMGNDSGLSEELDNTLYVCAVLCDRYAKDVSAYADLLPDVLHSYDDLQGELSAYARAVVDGETTVQQALTEGVCDLV